MMLFSVTGAMEFLKTTRVLTVVASSLTSNNSQAAAFTPSADVSPPLPFATEQCFPSTVRSESLEWAGVPRTPSPFPWRLSASLMGAFYSHEDQIFVVGRSGRRNEAAAATSPSYPPRSRSRSQHGEQCNAVTYSRVTRSHVCTRRENVWLVLWTEPSRLSGILVSLSSQSSTFCQCRAVLFIAPAVRLSNSDRPQMELRVSSVYFNSRFALRYQAILN